MNICTIATADWVEGHLKRWVRYARKNTDATLHLILAAPQEYMSHPVVQSIDQVKWFDPAVAQRKWFNSVRMKATTLFNVDEILYIDCDADILGNIEDISKQSKKPLLWCQSPVMHKEWPPLCSQLSFGWPEWEANNGLLYMRKDFSKEFEKASKAVWKLKPNERIAGTFVFNAMLRLFPKIHAEIPQEYSHIWWNCQGLSKARIVQYCNDRGQAKRLELEALYDATA